MPNDKNDTCVITAARYEIVDIDGNIINSGSADVDGSTVGFLFQPDTRGYFIVRLFVTVPPETVETEITIDVRC